MRAARSALHLCRRTFVTTILAVLATAVACSTSDLLSEIDGVWRGQKEGEMITIAVTGEQKHFTIETGGEKVEVPVTVKSVDKENHIVSFDVKDASTGETHVWSIRQVWNDKETEFMLTITLHDGTTEDLAFVRKR